VTGAPDGCDTHLGERRGGSSSFALGKKEKSAFMLSMPQTSVQCSVEREVHSLHYAGRVSAYDVYHRSSVSPSVCLSCVVTVRLQQQARRRKHGIAWHCRPRSAYVSALLSDRRQTFLISNRRSMSVNNAIPLGPCVVWQWRHFIPHLSHLSAFAAILRVKLS